ncbi:homoserine kinase [Sphingomonas jatrophae]|uniref:Homoserine kinase n=1 Tax=Sphingomonas jatrophae TaxID=1166337 RepID=A0A1I6L438_9SPHN|nr:homoserine kinase [Sphingomonas jatrophae]SFR98192.1 homoserine kinase [Sphingomonas jatrophae]
MAVYTHVSAEALGQLLARYDVGDLVSSKGIAEGVENSNYLVDTDRARFILTLYEKRVDAGDLPFFLALLDHLADRRLPVPRALRARDGTQVQQVAGRPACLIEYLPGVSLSHPTPAQARSAGLALGQMHKAVADFAPTRPNTLGADSWAPLFTRCGRDLDAIDPALHDMLAEGLDATLPAWPTDGDRCTIHADLFPDNVLMLGDAVAGVIDFYFACTDLRLYDLAVTHTSWSFDATGTTCDLAVGSALLEGYAASYGLSPAERQLLPILCMGACLRFALTRAWDWLNTPANALVTRKDPLAYTRRLAFYRAAGAAPFA